MKSFSFWYKLALLVFFVWCNVDAINAQHKVVESELKHILHAFYWAGFSAFLLLCNKD